MTVHLLLTPAGAGKTTQAIECIRACPPLSRVCVLVPGQLQAAAFRRRLAQAGGALGVEIQTFYGLYAEVLALAAGESEGLTRLPPPVRHRLIRHLVETLCDADEISYYAPLRTSSGFAHLLSELFEELKRARVFPEDLESALTPSPWEGEGWGEGPRLTELPRLYTAYQSWLIENGWVDSEGQGWLTAIALEEQPELLSDLSLLVVDGFDEFDPTQLHLLHLLSARADETLITLTGDPDRPERLAHRRLARARAALTEALDLEVTSAPLHTCSSAPLLHLEAHLFEPDATPAPAGEAVTFLEAQNRAAEAREALRWLKARVVREGVSLSNVALIARDVTPYRPFLEEVAAEFGLPLRFGSGASLRTNSAIAALLNLLTLPLEPDPWAPRALLDALTSPYFDWRAITVGAGGHETRPYNSARRLYDLALAGQVVSGLDQWREALQRLSARADEEERLAIVDEEELAPRRAFTAEEVARLEEAFEVIVARITPPRAAAMREWVSWLETLIGENAERNQVFDGKRSDNLVSDDASLRVIARARENAITAERDTAALQALKDVLRGMVLANNQISPLNSQLSILHSSFVAELIQAIESTGYAIPVEGDAILVLSAPEARGLAFDSVALLGLSEGDFPRAESDTACVLLPEPDRARLAERGLPLDPHLRGEEATFFYQAVTRARRRLLLSRPYLADDGQGWEPSPYWTAARALFDDAQVLHVRPTDPVRHPASEQERAAAPAPGQPQGVSPTSETRTGDLSALTEELGRRFGPERSWSSSKLETYAKCPYYFWAAYVMEMEPQELPEAGFDVLTLGSIYHLVLERLYERVPDGDPERLRAGLDAVAQEVYEAAPEDYGFRPTPLWERQQEELTEVLRRTLEELIAIAADYEPLVPELAFGLRGKPPLIIRGEETVLQLRGYIDRVDRAPDGRLRIIDYKAGSTPISPRDLTEGKRLQLPLYALAAQAALTEEVDSGFYWHIGSARPSTLKLEDFDGGVESAIETAVDYALEIVAAVRAGRFAPTPSHDGCPRFCPAAAFCEHFEARSW